MNQPQPLCCFVYFVVKIGVLIPNSGCQFPPTRCCSWVKGIATARSVERWRMSAFLFGAILAELLDSQPLQAA